MAFFILLDQTWDTMHDSIPRLFVTQVYASYGGCCGHDWSLGVLPRAAPHLEVAIDVYSINMLHVSAASPFS